MQPRSIVHLCSERCGNGTQCCFPAMWWLHISLSSLLRSITTPLASPSLRSLLRQSFPMWPRHQFRRDWVVEVRNNCSEQSRVMPLSVPTFRCIDPVNKSVPSLMNDIASFLIITLSFLHWTADNTEKRLLSRSGTYRTCSNSPDCVVFPLPRGENMTFPLPIAHTTLLFASHTGTLHGSVSWIHSL